VPSTDSSLNLIITGGAGFIGSNLTLALQERFPNARLTVIDDFRSGDFKNLAGYHGDLVAQNLATLDWREQFGEEKFDAIFHLASITDTTVHDQFILPFAAAKSPDWIIIGLRYFNVYGPREAHKGGPASMVYHLAQQMKAGQRPRIFKHGEQKRDFVYVKDAVEGSILALEALQSGIYNLGCGQARSFNELVDILNKCLGTKLPPDYIDNPHAHYQNFTEADLDKVRSTLGYAPQFPLEEGVRDYVKWLYGS